MKRIQRYVPLSLLWLELVAGTVAVLLASPVKAAPVLPAVTATPLVSKTIATNPIATNPIATDPIAPAKTDKIDKSKAPIAAPSPTPSPPPPPSTATPATATSTGVKILTPIADAVMDTPAATVTLQFAIGS